MNITAEETELISQWNARPAQPVSIRFVRTRHPMTGDFEAFLEDLRKIAPRIEVLSEVSEEAEPPAIYVGKALRYHALPRGGELEPFLEALSMLQNRPWEPLSEEIGKLADEIEWPAQIKIYVTPHCPFCPRVLRQLQPLALADSLLGVTVIDGSLFPEMAGKDGVRSVPTTILDSGVRWTGVMRPEEVRDALVHRDPSQLSAETLKSFIKEGNASRLADMMLHREMIFPAFLALLLHPEWSVRLGAMVAAEEIGERNPMLALELLPGLWEHIEGGGVQDSVKGDVVYLMGALGSREWIPALERFLVNTQGEELREIVVEALEMLRTSPEE